MLECDLYLEYLMDRHRQLQDYTQKYEELEDLGIVGGAETCLVRDRGDEKGTLWLA